MPMTYDSLYARVADYIDRSDTDTRDRIPDFISDAQYRLSNSCKTIGQEGYVTGHFIAGIATYQKPSNWIRNVSINCGSGENFEIVNVLSLRTYEFCRNFTPNPGDISKRSLPLFYSDYGYSNFIVSPTPDQNYPYEFSYIGLPFPITPQNQTNWWTNYAPQVLFSAVMSEAHFFLQNYDRAEAYEAKTEKGIQMLNTQDEMRIVDRASARQAD